MDLLRWIGDGIGGGVQYYRGGDSESMRIRCFGNRQHVIAVNAIIPAATVGAPAAPNVCYRQGWTLWTVLMIVAVVVFTQVITCFAAATVATTSSSRVRDVWAVPGQNVELPCDVTPPRPGDAVKMVFWFKDTMQMPLYSIDARSPQGLSVPNHLVSSDMGRRLSFISTPEDPGSARLRIRSVVSTDAGIFRCRVDFIDSPTRSFMLNLNVVEQPSNPRIFVAEGHEVITEAGPFLEGQEMFLSCEVTGGHPLPSLMWFYHNAVVDEVVDSPPNATTTVNHLRLVANRTMRGEQLECRTQSSIKHYAYISKFVRLNVYLKPSRVKIIGVQNKPFPSNKPVVMKCETSGSYPPAMLSWLLDGKPIKNPDIKEEETMKQSRSIIQFTPMPEHDGKELSCRSTNPRFPGSAITDQRVIKVAYPPRLWVVLESNGVPNAPVVEDTTVSLRCDSEATPPAHSFTWYHDGHVIRFNQTAGVVIEEHILNLTVVRKQSQGKYTCAATNTEGETYSDPYHLQVNYAPRCVRNYELTRVGAMAHETLVVQCHVDSLPPVTKFHWTYNTSRGVMPIKGSKEQHNVDEGVATLHFTPGTTDIESLACWAENAVGRQQMPCLFVMVPAYNPEPPRNCRLQNITEQSPIGALDVLEVICLAGRDGGLQQSFVLEVIATALAATDADGSTPSTTISKEMPPPLVVVTTLSDQGGDHYTPLYRVHGQKPVFRLHSLEPGRDYQLLVYAENAKGRSNPPVLLSNVRVNGEPLAATITTEDQLSNASDPLELTSNKLTTILVYLVAVVLVLILAIVIAAGVLACKRQPSSAGSTSSVTGAVGTAGTAITLRHGRRQRRSSKPPSELELSEAGFNEGFHRRSAQYRASMYAIDVDGEAVYGRQVSTGPDLILAPANFAQQQF